MAKESNYNEELNKVLEGLFEVRISKEKLEKAFHLIMAGADPNTKNKYQQTILIQVIYLKDFDLFKKFVNDAKCSTNIEDYWQKKPIDYAMGYLCPKIVEWFLDNGSDANEIISYGRCKYKRLHALSDFLFYSDIEVENAIADVENAIAIAKLLIAKGANIVEMDERGWLPWQLAERNRPHGGFTEFLKEETEKMRDKLNTESNEKLKIAKASETDLELMAENKEIKKKLSEMEERFKKMEEQIEKLKNKEKKREEKEMHQQ